ncbi:MAG: beta-lactamase family protein [Clostridia bacterium]|nr:beta-lactamase family protein [Clostridia bacterium]
MKHESGLEKRVQAFAERIRREDINLHGWMLTVRCQEKARAVYAPFREDQPHRMYSVSKTMVAIALAMLMEEGKLRLEDPIVRFFPDLLPPSPPPELTAVTIVDMFRMATCYRQTAYREYEDADWTLPFFTGKPDHAPGAVFNYDTGASQVLSSLVRRLSGKEVVDFLEERLFTPLGCEDSRFWLRDPSGQCTGGTGLCMSLRDLNRVALCLSRGGDGLIPGWFMSQMQQKQIDTLLRDSEEERYGYGWQCWRTRAGWVLYGMGGQLAVLCPEKDAVFCSIGDVRLDSAGMQRIYDAFFEELYPWLDREDMAPVRLELPAPTLKDVPEARRVVSGSYQFPEENPLGWTQLQMKEDCLCYENARGSCRLPFRAGETLCADYPGWPGEPATVSAAWYADGALRIRCHAIGNSPCGFDMVLVFTGDSVTVQSRRSADRMTDGYAGSASGKALRAE